MWFRFSFFALVAAIYFWPMTADAQTFVCPSGPGPGEIQVGTTGGSGGVAVIPICASNGEENSAEDPGVWEKRWGAVATGGGGFGAVTDMRSEKQAKKLALAQCKGNKAGDPSKCKAFTYYNQCVASTVGPTRHFIQSAVDLQTAESLAMQSCQAVSDGCSVYYNGCSYAQRVN